jgi:hypothetical protein
MKRLFVILAMTLALVVPQTAMAFQLLQPACNAGGGQSVACNTRSGDPISGTNQGILYQATKLIALIAGVSSVILIVVSGIFFALSNGDASKIAGARNTLIGAVIGLLIVVSAQVILNFVLNKV